MAAYLSYEPLSNTEMTMAQSPTAAWAPYCWIRLFPIPSEWLRV